jgi:hypothetical protein
MRLIITSILLMTSGIAFSQNEFGIKVGGIHSMIDRSDIAFKKLFGYYGGVYSSQQVNKFIEATGEFTFSDQRFNGEAITYSIKSTNGSFSLHFCRGKQYLITGFEMGFFVSSKSNGENINGFDKGRMGNIFGIGYKIENRIRAELKYISTINNQLFDRNFQFGIKYSFKH